MSKFHFFKNISLIIALLIVVYLVATYAGLAKQTLFEVFSIPGSSVKGASTARAEELSEKFTSDIAAQLELAQDYLLQLTLADAINGFSRLQKIPQDVQAIKEYSTQQIESIVKRN